MSVVTLVIGLAAVIFGVYTMFGRSRCPEQYTKLKAMQDRLGEKQGHRLHFIAYTLVPIIFGAIMILAGLYGASFF
jgi:hypothetical protein